MIHKDQLPSLYLQACPGFGRIWLHHLARWEEDTPRPYLNAGLFAHYLAVAVERKISRELPAASRLLERLLEDGDREVQRLAAVGIIGSLKEAAKQSAHETAAFRRWLGPWACVAWEQGSREPQPTAEEKLPPLKRSRISAALVAVSMVVCGIIGVLCWNWERSIEMWSVAALLAVWLGLSVGERVQRRRQAAHLQALDRQARTHGLPYDPQMRDAICRVVGGEVEIPWYLKVMQGAMALAFISGWPLTFIAVTGAELSPATMRSGPFLLAAVTGVAAAWAFVLWSCQLFEARYGLHRAAPLGRLYTGAATDGVRQHSSGAAVPREERDRENIDPQEVRGAAPEQ